MTQNHKEAIPCLKSTLHISVLPVVEEFAAPELEDVLDCQTVARGSRIVQRIHSLQNQYFFADLREILE